jgi:hypothetical protein
MLIADQWSIDLLELCRGGYKGKTICVDARELEERLSELQRLRVALPSTADGVTVVPGMKIYDTEGCEASVGGTWFDTIARYPAGSDETDNIRAEYFYSSIEAAERAKGKMILIYLLCIPIGIACGLSVAEVIIDWLDARK